MTQPIHVNLKREWLEEDGIAVYQPSAINVDMLISWDRHIVEMVETWTAPSPCCLIYDLSDGGLSLPYLVFNNFRIEHIVTNTVFKTRIEQLLQANAQLTIGLGIVISSHFTGRILSSRVHEFPGSNRMLIDTFFTRDSAVVWLKSISAASANQTSAG